MTDPLRLANCKRSGRAVHYLAAKLKAMCGRKEIEEATFNEVHVIKRPLMVYKGSKLPMSIT